MKKIILLSICALTCTFVSHSQTPSPYVPGTTLQGNGFTYICDSPTGLLVRIYNEENYLVDLQQTLRNGDEIPSSGLYISAGFDKSSQSESYDKFKIIINDVLSEWEKHQSDDQWLLMNINISSNTGIIVGVEFSFDSEKKGFSHVSLEHYYEIESRMKEEITYQIDSIGRTYNFCRTMLFFNGRYLDY